MPGRSGIVTIACEPLKLITETLGELKTGNSTGALKVFVKIVFPETFLYVV